MATKKKKKVIKKKKGLNKKKLGVALVVLITTICLVLYILSTIFSFVLSLGSNISYSFERDTIYQASLVAVGDNMIHKDLYKFASLEANENHHYDFSKCYKNIKPYIQGHDISYINQECIIAGDDAYSVRGYPNFNSPEDLIPALKDTGFNVVNGASNHSADQGFAGLKSSCKVWRQHPDITFFGIYDSKADRANIRIVEKHHIKFAFLSYVYGVNGYKEEKQAQHAKEPYMITFLQDEATMKTEIERAKELADVVVVTAHWGVEYTNNTTEQQRYYAKFFADMGVDIVIGSHSHTIQPMQWVKGKGSNKTLVIYSLGNFISAMDTEETQLEGMVELNVSKHNEKIEIKDIVFTPLINHHNDDIYTVYRMKDYNEDLLKKHSVLKGKQKAYDKLKETVTKTIPDDFKIDM